MVRVHVQTSLLDLFTAAHRASAWTLHKALARVARECHGVVVILDQEEATADMLSRIRRLQRREQSLELTTARDPQELRTYGLGGRILADLGVGKMRVLGNAMKAPGLSGFGLEIVEYIDAEQEQNPQTRRQAKHTS
jgi:3,4-dihydroxy 2-butanone 4-phosphate synthase/GTP cyclohydrolase II